MIVRVVLLQMKPQYRSYGQVRLLAKKTREVLPNAARVIDLKIHLASDPRTERDWDMSFLVKFASMQDTEVYRNDPVHRAFADVFLKPMLERIYVYHFEEA